MRRLLLLLVALALPACSALVQGGLPRPTPACNVTSDCSVAGSQFVCADGGCMILGCVCNTDCAPFGLNCYAAPAGESFVMECLNIAPDGGTPCDGG
jgi:hypothetical protein